MKVLPILTDPRVTVRLRFFGDIRKNYCRCRRCRKALFS